MDLTLDPEEASLLVRVVRNRLEELRQEVHHTRDSDDRGYLKHKESLLQRILGKFPPGMDESAHQKGYTQQ